MTLITTNRYNEKHEDEKKEAKKTKINENENARPI